MSHRKIVAPNQKSQCLVVLTFLLFIPFTISVGQSLPSQPIQPIKQSVFTPVKSQDATGTCWSFSTTSLVESQTLSAGAKEIDLSEMFTVRNIYLEKARNYVLRQGAAQFGQGGLGHDVIRSIAVYGAVTESIYSGLLVGKTSHDHSELETQLKKYLDSLLRARPLPADWLAGVNRILDSHMGSVPAHFEYKEKHYTPATFAMEVLKFKAEDYINLTSFSHHPFYRSFVLEVPDNFSSGVYHNIPLEEMIRVTAQALEKGYSVMWDADVSNKFFRQRQGFAMQWKNSNELPSEIDPDEAESEYNQVIRQQLFENLTTQDDHLMHIVGIGKTQKGKRFFIVKNSWGETGPYKGLIYVSEAYFAINTISLVIPRESLDDVLLKRLDTP